MGGSPGALGAGLASAAPASGLQRSGAAGSGAVHDPAFAAFHAPHASSLLTVAPLNLGLQHFGIQQLDQLRGLHPLDQMGSAPPLPPPAPLRLTDGSAPPLACGVMGTSGAPRGAQAPSAPGLLPSPLSMLPPELLARPFTLPPGLLPSGVPLLDPQPVPRSLYARPPKRQERTPMGDSEDSNASTDSHAVTMHPSSHDEDEGGTGLAGTSITSGRGGAPGRGVSCSPPSSGLFLPPSFFGRQAGLPLLAGAPPPPLPSVGSGGAQGPGSAFAAAFAGPDGPPNAASLVAGGGEPESSEAGPVILLPTRRSKGPRGRASSATPSSSTQS
ncbi:hypothetical protein GPECTOR_1g27 [Gonium pectorale]|uniref:Uncharacterized protein n=1 Tax=Gonium pectorale TaxID=33097 RepID=A0A150H2C7_GONPE|nr:hypothetical protein GPECTOR_1g27 [Gonium pectorale]|eukprot:KXZ56306.1 hypothetical protein GPECTOR_1g27 [Gonium pectorale]